MNCLCINKLYRTKISNLKHWIIENLYISDVLNKISRFWYLFSTVGGGGENLIQGGRRKKIRALRMHIRPFGDPRKINPPPRKFPRSAPDWISLNLTQIIKSIASLVKFFAEALHIFAYEKLQQILLMNAVTAFYTIWMCKFH